MRRWLPAVLVAGLLGGCSATHVKDPLEAGELNAGASIGVLPINFLEKASVEINKNPVRFAGTAGRLAVLKGKDTKRRKFSEALAARDYDYRQQFNDYLARRLEAGGFSVAPMKFRRSIDNVLGEVPPGRFEKRYPEASAHDYLLDVYIEFVGYSALSLSDPYLPTVHIGARLVGARSHETLYQSLIEYRPFTTEGEATKIEPNPDFSFEDFDALMADSAVAQRGLEQAIEAVVDRLLEELSPAAA